MTPLSTSSHSQSTSPKSVLIYIVDDEPMIGELVQAILQREGFQSSFFQYPDHALIAFEKAAKKPDLLLTDYRMDPMSGLELIEQCKRLKPDLKTILYSGNVGSEPIQNHRSKPERFLKKPFLPQTLLEVVHATLAS